MNRIVLLTLIAITLLVVGLFVGLSPAKAVQEKAVRAVELQDAALAGLYGGSCLDEYCVVTAETCNTSPGAQCKLTIDNGTCMRCTSDTQREGCDGDNICFWWTCTSCIPDPPVACGNETLGNCDNGVCDSFSTGQAGFCGQASKCHTS